MPRQVEPEREFLILQPFAIGPARHIGKDNGGRGLRVTEEADLVRAPAGLLRAFHRGPDRSEEPPAMIVQCIERACPNQRLDDAAVHDALVYAMAQIEQVLERSAGSTGLDDVLDRRFAGAFDRAQAIADYPARGRG